MTPRRALEAPPSSLSPSTPLKCIVGVMTSAVSGSRDGQQTGCISYSIIQYCTRITYGVKSTVKGSQTCPTCPVACAMNTTVFL